MKHKNSEMIKSVIDNTELVIFCEVIEHDNESGNYWAVSNLSSLVSCHNNFFLCLPQHKESCLHWLNGGEVQVRDFVTSPFCDVTDWSKEWLADGCGFMVDSWVFRIKPKKAKRWIGVYNHNVTSQHFDSIETAKSFIRKRDEFKNCTPEAWKFIEIEVEV